MLIQEKETNISAPLLELTPKFSFDKKIVILFI